MRIDSSLAMGLGLPFSRVQSISDISEFAGERLRIARLLRDVDELQTIPVGSFLTKDPDPQVRCEIALMLGSAAHLAIVQRRDKLASNVFRHLKNLAGDKDWRVRHNAALGVLTYGSEKGLNVIERLLQDEVPLVRTAAFRAYLGLLALHPEAAAKLQGIQIKALGNYQDVLNSSEGRIELLPLAETQAVEPVLIRSRSGVVPILVPTPPRRFESLKLASIFSPDPEDVATKFPKEHQGVVTKLSFGTTKSPMPRAFPKAEASASHGDAGSDQAPPAGGGGSGSSGGGPSREAQYITPPGPPRRYVNSWFDNHPSPMEPLHSFQEYTLGIEVSPELRVGTLTEDDPEFREPDFGSEEFLDVVVAIVTDDFEVLEKPAKLMRLPKDPAQRSDQVTFKVRPIKTHRDVHIHVLFYRRNSLFQESIIGARVEVMEPLSTPAPTSYFPAENKLHTTPLRGSGDLNLQIVKMADTYRFVLFYDFGNGDFDIMWCMLPANQEKLVNLVMGMRSDLLSVINSTAVLADGKQGKIFYDGEPAAQAAKENRLPHLYRLDDTLFIKSLKVLAEAGGNLFVNLFFSGLGSKQEQERAMRVGLKLRELSSRPLKIQILSDAFFLPWNLLYVAEEYPDDESLADGIWGFKHLIEELPGTRDEEGEVDDLIAVDKRRVPLGMNLNKNILGVLIDPQLKELRRVGPSVDLLERYSEAEVLSALQGKTEQAQLEYFYCHAGVSGDSQQSFDQSYIGLTSADSGLTLKDIKLKAIGARLQGKPVVFLNACESSRMDGRFYDGFVPKFLTMGARAVVGSDCEIPSLLGAHFGTRFLKAFLGGDAIGVAMLKLRKDFLQEYKNPLGLIYRVFGNADVRLSSSLF